MRAILTVALPKKSETEFQTDDDFLSIIRGQGWDDPKIAILPKDKQTIKYQEMATHIWKQMPEVAQDEKEYLIFCGYFQDNQTDVIITRRNVGFAKVRLLNANLDKLQDSTEKMVEKLVVKETDSKKPQFEIANKTVEILEKNEIHEIIQGRVITNAWKEAKLKNSKNYSIAFWTFFAFLGLFFTLIILRFVMHYDKDDFWYETNTRLHTVALTTFIVSAFDFWTTYKQIKENKIISWTVSTEIAKKAKELVR